MKIAVISGRAALVTGEGRHADVERESEGRFGPSIDSLYRDWAAFRSWAEAHEARELATHEPEELGNVSPDASQVFAIGLNYAEHSAETGLAAGVDFPPVFPKWASSLADPFHPVTVPANADVDWEVELVTVIGTEAREVTPEEAQGCIAGYAIGQDFSDRRMQFVGAAPQFGLAKSHAGFSPVGPWLVTPDELGALGGQRITTTVDGVIKQEGTLGQMIFGVPQIISILSAVVTLRPGDLIFTGTPSGVGYARTPAEFLHAGSEVVSEIEGIGVIRQTMV